jgi:hypothetical protein
VPGRTKRDVVDVVERRPYPGKEAGTEP